MQSRTTTTTYDFVSMGRAKRCWNNDVPNGTPQEIVHNLAMEVRRNGGLASRDIEVTFDFDHGRGAVFAGTQAVGRIERRGAYIGDKLGVLRGR
jgi:hypothetical protein